MQLSGIPFDTTNWSQIEPTVHRGERGHALWRTRRFGGRMSGTEPAADDPTAVRVRMVEYTPDYLADHWCEKGHIVLCLEGEVHTELADGRVFTLKPGMSYQVADNSEPHRSRTGPHQGAKLFIVD